MLGHNNGRPSTYYFGETGATSFGNNQFPDKVSRNGVPLVSPFAMSPINVYFIMKVVVNNNDPAARACTVGRTAGWSGADYDIAEIIGYNHMLTSAEENAVGYYLESKYGLTTQYTEPAPEIGVTGLGNSITNGAVNPTVFDDRDFGSVLTNTPETRTFTIQNTGSSALALTGTPLVVIAGTDFFVTNQPATTVGLLGSTTFQVTFMPASAGDKTGTVSIANNDSDENPFTFIIKGKAVAVPAPKISVKGTDGNGTKIRHVWDIF